MLDFQVVKRAGLRQAGELDLLFGVSRAMVGKYLAGISWPRGANRLRAAKVVEVLSALLAENKLPISADKDAEFRRLAVLNIRAIITSHTE